mmetsp:Transcript_475/g.1641  ORF Transcript_475/g.1641 Transcript_475/m.1641 type:complete len:527 (+) Transcript_475:277-1857(+)|eukprot:CAMPEP_0198731396 /NCGR_PEP_ID=MMETSP1475-20131203/29521_1 /TAXON_ID= ORGANISM="Unidentified sp., Strain CCMP1999" /NCGR_SAMPLE_ID=MMETSP1475 /ASSEMBLY_ACC=CAM_ASM_001111 /LENGTH=526 /DNA_ID=CAMNT_0044494355 /DNA_START=134 /DNA_END=1714 /DNA_ORIENTATION=-
MATLKHPPPTPLSAFISVKKSFLSQRRLLWLSLRGAVLTAQEEEEGTSTLWSLCLIDTLVKGKDKGRSIVVIAQKSISVRLFFNNDNDYGTWLDTLARASTWKLQNFYDLEEEIGQGQFARVKKGYEKLTREPVAVKIVRKRHQNVRVLDFVEREYEIMKVLDHPNIIKTFDVFDEPDRLYIVLEYMPGGQLFDVIQHENRFTEKHACQVMRDVLLGLQYLHANNIVHRDIKPENILCKTKQFPLEVKIADFGLANFIDSETATSGTEHIGTPLYIAPEIVLQQKHSSPVDLWACGVLMYIMLSGRFPFIADSPQLVMKKVVKGIYSFPNQTWRFVSIDAKMLIRGLLKVDQEERFSADECLKHRWLIRADRLSEHNLTENIVSFRNSTSGRFSGKLAGSGLSIHSSSKSFTCIYFDDEESNRNSGNASQPGRSLLRDRGSVSFLTRAEADMEDIQKSSLSNSPLYRAEVNSDGEDSVNILTLQDGSFSNLQGGLLTPETSPTRVRPPAKNRKGRTRRELFRSMGF